MPKVRIYSTATCAYCKLEKAYFDQKGVKYENIMVDQDPEKAREMIELSGQMGVPYTVVTKDDGTEVGVLGFNKPKLDELIGIS